MPKLEVDMAQLEFSEDSEGSDQLDKNSTMSRLQQESESFLASLHSTPDLSSTGKTATNALNAKKNHQSKHTNQSKMLITQKFNKLHRLDLGGTRQSANTSGTLPHHALA